jgi:hypothetical protein
VRDARSSAEDGAFKPMVSDGRLTIGARHQQLLVVRIQRACSGALDQG